MKFVSNPFYWLHINPQFMAGGRRQMATSSKESKKKKKDDKAKRQLYQIRKTFQPGHAELLISPTTTTI
ncbi:hypothetical protein I7I50_09150 [Histoplasma capsulatum G186AR]|uniref:Uncharacterized protein n=1 Tax=Ajellomyces capsulatus TaxID=5037 RepID=A0A8H7YPI2_AJECA|nr:hypothetical protein I7I52_06671 [Histoplasma capsulatum]QSS74106.1 hypothetical protein I7I50_09150 [Histoplasma capsulatum G186AR]